MNHDDVRRVAKLMGELFIARRDCKATEYPTGGWHPVDEPWTVSDFDAHLNGLRSYGTYLLDTDSRVRFFAFDIDLSKECSYFVIRDIEEMENDPPCGGELDPDARTGNLEAALHDPTHDGHRWAFTVVRDAMRTLSRSITDNLGLKHLCLVTGGGAHLLVPLGGLRPASEAREAIRAVVDATDYLKPIRGNNFFKFSDSEQPALTIEAFPKQDTIAKDGYGNLLRLPYGLHPVGVRTFAVDPHEYPAEPYQWVTLDPLKALESMT